MSTTLPHAPGIYQIICIPTGKIYVGSAIDLYKRWMQHLRKLRDNVHDNSYLQNAWNKHGEKSFVLEVIEFVMPFSLLDREQYWLDKLKPYDHKRGFNINPKAHKPPSPIGRVLSPESKAKISAAHIGKIISKETRAKLQASHMGQERTPETRAKIGAASKGNQYGKGYRHTLEARRKISEAGRRPCSPETKEKIRKANLGHPVSPETTAKRRKKQEKTFIVTAPDGQEMLVKGVKQFCRENGLNYQCMLRVANGRQSNHHGWRCRHA